MVAFRVFLIENYFIALGNLCILVADVLDFVSDFVRFEVPSDTLGY